MTEEKTTHVTDFATAPRRVAEFITPFDLCAAIVAVLKPESHEVIYDGAFGTASLLLSVQEYLTKSGASNSENICGREINLNNYETGCKRADAVGLETENLLLSNSLEVNGKDAGKYDVILSNPPLGSKGELREGELGFKTRSGDNKLLQHYINSLKLGGRAAIVVTNGFFSQSDPASVGIRKYLIEHCDLHTVLQLPPNTLQYTAIPISVIFFNKGKNTSNIRYYLKNKEEGYVEFLELINKNTTNKRSYYYNVDCIHDNSFTLPTASQIAIQQEIDEKIGNFKEFKRHKNEKVFLEINLTKEKFEEKSNTVYLPKLGYSPCVTCIGRTTLKHQNYFQLVVDSNIILPGYLVYYLRSNLGQMILDGLKTGVAIPTISKKNLIENLTIFAPNIEEQELIASTFETLADVMSLIDKTAVELSSDPNSAKNILDKLSETREVFNDLSVEEKILKLIKGGENLKIEFKETLSKNIHTAKKDANLQTSVLKNIVGFLNKNGGQLLIGVADDGKVTGIEEDFYKDDDKYKLLLSHLINDRIGLNRAGYVEVKIHTVKSKKVCLINCSKAKEPTYLDDEFYIRTDPECRKLSTKDANEYIREHF